MRSLAQKAMVTHSHLPNGEGRNLIPVPFGALNAADRGAMSSGHHYIHRGVEIVTAAREATEFRGRPRKIVDSEGAGYATFVHLYRRGTVQNFVRVMSCGLCRT